MPLKIKPEYAGTIIGFNKNSLPLGRRSEADLNFLYQRAVDRNISAWIAMFEVDDVLTEIEIESQKEKAFIEKQNQKQRVSNKNTEEPN